MTGAKATTLFLRARGECLQRVTHDDLRKRDLQRPLDQQAACPTLGRDGGKIVTVEVLAAKRREQRTCRKARLSVEMLPKTRSRQPACPLHNQPVWRA